MWFLPRVACQTFIVQINPQLLGPQRPQFIFREHAQHRFAQHPVRTRRPQALGRHFLQPAGIAAVMAIDLLLELISSQANLVGIDHHDVIPTIQIRRIVGLVLADQNARDALGYFAKFLPPVVANGKVYAGTFSSELVVYGLMAER